MFSDKGYRVRGGGLERVVISGKVMHWMMVPFVTAQWVKEPFWVAVFVFIQACDMLALRSAPC